MDKLTIYKNAIEHWGEELQVGMLTEEIGELMIAVNKLRRNLNSVNKLNLEEEIGDVEIMLEQIIVLFYLDRVRIDLGKKSKLKKLERMIINKSK